VENTTAKAAEKPYKFAGPTNEIVKIVEGIKHRRLCGSGIVVSELGLRRKDGVLPTLMRLVKRTVLHG